MGELEYDVLAEAQSVAAEADNRGRGDDYMEHAVSASLYGAALLHASNIFTERAEAAYAGQDEEAIPRSRVDDSLEVFLCAAKNFSLTHAKEVEKLKQLMVDGKYKPSQAFAADLQYWAQGLASLLENTAGINAVNFIRGSSWGFTAASEIESTNTPPTDPNSPNTPLSLIHI